MSRNTLLTESEIEALRTAESSARWAHVEAMIKANRGGRLPPDWDAKVIRSGLATDASQRWNAPGTITVTPTARALASRDAQWRINLGVVFRLDPEIVEGLEPGNLKDRLEESGADVDEVLADADRTWREAFEEYLKSHGLEEVLESIEEEWTAEEVDDVLGHAFAAITAAAAQGAADTAAAIPGILFEALGLEGDAPGTIADLADAITAHNDAKVEAARAAGESALLARIVADLDLNPRIGKVDTLLKALKALKGDAAVTDDADDAGADKDADKATGDDEGNTDDPPANPDEGGDTDEG